MTITALRQSQQRAISRAQAARLVRLVEPVTASDYLVPSTSQTGRFYVVTHEGSRWICSCRAGRLNVPCAHSAAAWKLTVNESAAGTVQAGSN